MKEDATTKFEVHPDLMEAPHVLPLLMELFAGDRQVALARQEQMNTHLAACEYCRAAVIVLLSTAQEYDRRNTNAEGSINNLLARFTEINDAIGKHKNDEIEGHEYERMGAYVEMVMAEGWDQADLRFPDTAIHLKSCSDCRAMVTATIASMDEEEDSE
jgi:hypothetical protein